MKMIGAILLIAVCVLLVGGDRLARGAQGTAVEGGRAVALELGGHGEGERERSWSEDSQVFEWDEKDLHVLVAGGSKSVDVPGAEGAIVTRGVISLTFLKSLPFALEDPALQPMLAKLRSSKRLVNLSEDALVVQCFDLKDFRPTAREALAIGRTIMQRPADVAERRNRP